MPPLHFLSSIYLTLFGFFHFIIFCSFLSLVSPLSLLLYSLVYQYLSAVLLILVAVAENKFCFFFQLNFMAVMPENSTCLELTISIPGSSSSSSFPSSGKQKILKVFPFFYQFTNIFILFSSP